MPPRDPRQLSARPLDRKLAAIGETLSKRPEMRALAGKLPPHVRDEILAGFGREMRERYGLINCDDNSILDCLSNALLEGLVPSRECCFIPRKVAGKERATYQRMYPGDLRMVRQAGATNVRVRAVHRGDEFDVDIAADNITHKMSKALDRHSQPITHVYARLTEPSGQNVCEVWTWDQIIAHRDQYSDAYRVAEQNGRKNSAWHTSPVGMAHKTVLLAAAKFMEKRAAIAAPAADAGDTAPDTHDAAIDAMFLLDQPTPPAALPPAESTEQSAAKTPAPAKTKQTAKRQNDSQPKPAPAKPAAAVDRFDDAANDRLEALALDLDRCEQISDVDARLETAISQCETPEEQFEAERYASSRKQEIRDGRGERSNAKSPTN